MVSMSQQPAAPKTATIFADARRGMDGSAYDSAIEAALSADLDEWTRRILQRHFDPIGGSPYWLGRAGKLRFDRNAITRYDELVRFQPFPLAVLRDHDPAEMVPRFGPRPLAGRIWDSGGTTGPACRVYYTDAMLDHRSRWRRWSWVAEGFERGRTWLHAAPSGPHLIGNGPHELSTYFEAQVFAIDMDPRWVKRMIRVGRLADVNDTAGRWPTEGVANVRPLEIVSSSPEGLY
jgi:phenylacetate-coenzyme A ligase PaaK-like adenylate-forming protein